MTTRTLSIQAPSSAMYVSGMVNGVDTIWTNTNENTWESVVDRSSDDKYLVELTIIDQNGRSSKSSITLYYGLLNLITDRTISDVEKVKTLRNKGYESLSESELREWLSGLKGSYNASDLNRVAAAVDYVSNRLTDNGYTPPQEKLKTDWNDMDVFKTSDMEYYLSVIHKLRNAITVFPTTPLAPSVNNAFTYKEANDIEKILFDVNSIIDLVISFVLYTGDLYCGEI